MFQQIVHVKYKREGLIYLLDVMNSVNGRVSTNKPISNILEKVFASIYFLSIFFFSSQDLLAYWS